MPKFKKDVLEDLLQLIIKRKEEIKGDVDKEDFYKNMEEFVRNYIAEKF